MTYISREAIEVASKAGDLDTLQRLIDEHGIKVVLLDDDPQDLTALHLAAAGGALNAVEFFLSPEIGADPCAARNNNFTPLHGAAMFGHAAICAKLLDAGASVDAQTDPQKYAPLHSAAFAGHMDAIRVLLARGANRDLLNYRDERPADTAKRQGQTEAQRLLET
jgi:ankyrin repeat protein